MARHEKGSMMMMRVPVVHKRMYECFLCFAQRGGDASLLGVAGPYEAV